MEPSREINIPANDKFVQAKLRELGEPIILFGELPLQRRERLKNLLTERGIENTQILNSSLNTSNIEEDELFYTEGTTALKQARLFLVNYSIPRAKQRIENQLQQRKEDDENQEKELERWANIQKSLTEKLETLKDFTLSATQVGDERPLSYCSLNHASTQLATSGWSGLCKLWNLENFECIQTFKGHTNKATCIIYHPLRNGNDERMETSSTVDLASSGVDAKCALWNVSSSSPLRVLEGHTERVNRISFHPSGKYLGSTSDDLTWRLWDIETGQCLLEQEGHSRPVFALAFQNDGALCCTGGADHIGRIWDLRSGRSIYVMRGHSQKILGAEFLPNGYQVATSSQDNTIRIWDLRKKRQIYTIPAHESVISQLKVHPSREYLFSSSFDQTIKFWSIYDFSLLYTLKGVDSKIMCADVSHDFSFVVTANWDRTWRIFKKI